MIEIKNLSKKIENNLILREVNISFLEGKSYALIGQNGCGKTTLIKSILGLNTLTDGEILFNEKSIVEDYHYRKEIGYMPQKGDYPKSMKVKDMIGLISQIRAHEPQDTELIDELKLEKIYNKKMGALSGGMVQKVSAVSAFLFHPKVIILDEPMAALDIISAEILKNKIIKEKKKGKIVIITSHLLGDLDEVVDEIVFMNEGQILISQSVEELKKQTGMEDLSQSIVSILKNIKNG